MRTPIVMVLLTLLPLTATAEQVKGTITKTGSVISIKVGDETTRLTGDLVSELTLLDGEAVTLDTRKAGNTLAVEWIVSPERTEVRAVGRTKNKKQVLVTDDGKTLTPVGRTSLISTTMQRTFDVWKFPAAADGSVRVSVIAYEATTTKSWMILSKKPELSAPTGFVRGRKSAWVEEESTAKGWNRIRLGDSIGWVPADYTKAVEEKPKQGMSRALDAAGG